jgi:hypothetical protein
MGYSLAVTGCTTGVRTSLGFHDSIPSFVDGAYSSTSIMAPKETWMASAITVIRSADLE